MHGIIGKNVPNSLHSWRFMSPSFGPNKDTGFLHSLHRMPMSHVSGLFSVGHEIGCNLNGKITHTVDRHILAYSFGIKLRNVTTLEIKIVQRQIVRNHYIIVKVGRSGS